MGLQGSFGHPDRERLVAQNPIRPKNVDSSPTNAKPEYRPSSARRAIFVSIRAGEPPGKSARHGRSLGGDWVCGQYRIPPGAQTRRGRDWLRRAGGQSWFPWARDTPWTTMSSRVKDGLVCSAGPQYRNTSSIAVSSRLASERRRGVANQLNHGVGDQVDGPVHLRSGDHPPPRPRPTPRGYRPRVLHACGQSHLTPGGRVSACQTRQS